MRKLDAIRREETAERNRQRFLDLCAEMGVDPYARVPLAVVRAMTLDQRREYFEHLSEFDRRVHQGELDYRDAQRQRRAVRQWNARSAIPI